MAPSRAYRAGDRGASRFQDLQRGPAWRPAGRTGLARAGAKLVA